MTGPNRSSAKRWRRSTEHLRRKLLAHHWRIADAESVLATSWSAAGRFQEAEALLLRASEVISSQKGAMASETREARRRLAELHDELGRPEKVAEHKGLLARNP